MIRYCVNCDAERNLREERRRQSLVVKGDRIEFAAPVLVCEDCGETVAEPGYDDAVLQTAYDLYRERHGLLTSSKIVELRQRYAFSQRALCRLLGWGEVTIQRYEKGVIQDRAHDEVLRSLRDPRRVLELLDGDSDKLTPSERERYRERAQAILEQERSAWLLREVEGVLRYRVPDLYNGFRDFDLDRFIAVVLWFATYVERLSKTKLAKLLWLADFKNFRDHGVSITGATYARLPFGPMPDQFQLLLGLAVEAGAIMLVEESFCEYIGEVVQSLKSADDAAFEEGELAALEFVLTKFGQYSAKELSELSHKEDAWRNRAQGELISYDEAKGMRILDLSSLPNSSQQGRGHDKEE